MAERGACSRLKPRGGRILQDYRCYFLDDADHILFPAEISAEDLEAAKRHAFGIVREQPERRSTKPTSIEIWQGTIQLFRSSVSAGGRRKVWLPDLTSGAANRTSLFWSLKSNVAAWINSNVRSGIALSSDWQKL